MCSLTLSNSFEEQLETLGQTTAAKIIGLLERQAFEANVGQMGTFDAPETNLEAGFAVDLRQAGVRKKRIAGHRIFFEGTHRDCNYTLFYVKLNKKSDNRRQDDNNPAFHEVVRRAFQGREVARRLDDPKIQAALPEAPYWQKQEWYTIQQRYLSSEMDIQAEAEEEGPNSSSNA